MDKNCVRCGQGFKPNRSDQIYCSRPCKELHVKESRVRPTLTCLHCGVSYIPKIYNPDRAKFCSRECKGYARTASGQAAVDMRRSYFKTRYNLTVEEVEEMASKGCGICGTTDWPGRHNRPHIDHDHETGKVRGLLCHFCNLGIGNFKNDPKILTAAIRYLGNDTLG